MHLVGRGLLPGVVENMLDAKVELDGRLRTVINEFTNSFATKMTASLPSAAASSTTSPQQAQSAVTDTRKAIEKEVPILRRLLDDYLDDRRTKETLVGAVQDTVMQQYEDFYDAYTSGESGRGRPPKRSGKEPVHSVWDTEAFGDWSEGVFRPGIASFEGDFGNEES